MVRGRPKGAKERWPNALIASEQAAIKAELDAVAEGARDQRRRLARALHRIGELEDDFTEVGQLRRYVYVVSALVHHERHGGLSDQQVQRLAFLGYAILQVQGIRSSSARLAYLYGDLHLALSLIHRKRGDHWPAAWEQQLAARLFKGNESRGQGFQALSLAIRMLRLGYAADAASKYALAEELAIDPRARMKARLGRLKATRLGGDLEAAAALGDATRNEAAADATPAERRELAWEALCLAAQGHGDLAPMVSAVRRGGTHEEAVFVVEAWLWTHAVSSMRWMERLPSMKTIARNKVLRPQRLGHAFECAKLIEQCYDKEVQFERKLKALGDGLATLNEIVSVDAEMLVLAAALRWLVRVRAGDLAQLTANRYRALSWSLTGGRDGDVLRVVGVTPASDDAESAA